jgi:pyridoxal phosphate enzyme (YggS family)
MIDGLVKANLININSQISKTCTQSGRTASDVTLVAVSKFQDDGKIDEALSGGLRVFGENRVQEAESHWAARRAQYPDLQLHLIGPLQSNKTKDAVALFDVIESIDRVSIAEEMAKECTKQHKNPVCLIQVNTGNEPQKAGVSLDDLPSLIQKCRDLKLNVQGLMCIPPVNDPAVFHFALLKKLAARHHLALLSMGMSADFECAIKVGATHIRIGGALFGDRQESSSPPSLLSAS